MQIFKDLRNSHTFHLRKGPLSFIEGVSSLLDVKGDIISKYNIDKAGIRTDCNSVYSDWQAVGADMHSAINQYEYERQ